MWVLTVGYDDYNQHGEYFMAAWNYKPSVPELFNVLREYEDGAKEALVWEWAQRLCTDCTLFGYRLSPYTTGTLYS